MVSAAAAVGHLLREMGSYRPVTSLSSRAVTTRDVTQMQPPHWSKTGRRQACRPRPQVPAGRAPRPLVGRGRGTPPGRAGGQRSSEVKWTSGQFGQEVSRRSAEREARRSIASTLSGAVTFQQFSAVDPHRNSIRLTFRQVLQRSLVHLRPRYL